MKPRTYLVLLASTCTVTTAFAGRDQAQIIQHQRAAALQAKALEDQPTAPTHADAEAHASKALKLLKQFHPKNAYGH